MLYIRTKYHIYEVDYVSDGSYFIKQESEGNRIAYEENEIIKKSNSIKDLCDVFVEDVPNLIRKNVPSLLDLIRDNGTLDDRMKCLIGKPLTYGLLSTDRGFDYVAKGKDRDSLELM